MKLTKQEMFDRAYRGLASQGWRRAVTARGCSYATPDGRRCAWGWVDTSLGGHIAGAVDDLGIGIAAGLNSDERGFAIDLQSTHDASTDPYLRSSFEEFARRHNLTIPELP